MSDATVVSAGTFVGWFIALLSPIGASPLAKMTPRIRFQLVNEERRTKR